MPDFPVRIVGRFFFDLIFYKIAAEEPSSAQLLFYNYQEISNPES
jgi:hypothetical protein